MDITPTPPATPDTQPPEPSPKRSLPIFALLLITLVIAVSAGAGIYVSRSAVPNESQVLPQPTTVAVQPTLIPLFLSLDKAQENAVIINGEAFVSGMTLPNTTVVIYSQLDTVATESDNHGHFEETVLVEESDATVTVTAIGQAGDEKSITIQLTEAPELSYVGRPQVLGETSQRQRVGNKTQVVGEDTQLSRFVSPRPTPPPLPVFLARPKRLEIRTKAGVAKMKEYLATDATENAKIARSLTIKAARIQEATTGASRSMRKAYAGIVTALGENSTTIAHLIDRSRASTVYFNAETRIHMKDVPDATTTHLAVAMRVVAVGHVTNEGLLADFIHIIPGSPNMPRMRITDTPQPSP